MKITNIAFALVAAASLAFIGCAGMADTSGAAPDLRDAHESSGKESQETDPANSGAQDRSPAELSGIWTGNLAVGSDSLPLVFRTAQDGQWVMDSPEQGVRGIPAELELSGSSTVRFTVPSAQGYFEGAVNAEGSIEGSWVQAGLEFPLILIRSDEESASLRRPQDPVPPYPYRSQVVNFENPEAGIILEGTLSIPEGDGPFPAVVLVSGSGPQNRDEEILGHRPFLVLSDALTRWGIAVLRYDDRGVGRSQGDFASASSEDFAGDALSALNYLKNRPETDESLTGLAGHSEGGLIGIYLGERNPDISFLVLLAPSVLPGDRQLILQNELLMRASGLSDAQIEANSAINRRLYDLALVDGDEDQIVSRMTDVMLSAGLSAADARAQAAGLRSSWMRFFLSYDPSAEINSLTMPVLALFGGLDVQVDARANSEPIRSETIEVRVYPGLNHLFQTAETGLPSEYGSISETMNPQVLEDIADWILSRQEG